MCTQYIAWATLSAKEITAILIGAMTDRLYWYSYHVPIVTIKRHTTYNHTKKHIKRTLFQITRRSNYNIVYVFSKHQPTTCFKATVYVCGGISLCKMYHNQFCMLITLLYLGNEQLGFYQETDSTLHHANVTTLIRVATQNDSLDESIFICS